MIIGEQVKAARKLLGVVARGVVARSRRRSSDLEISRQARTARLCSASPRSSAPSKPPASSSPTAASQA